MKAATLKLVNKTKAAISKDKDGKPTDPSAPSTPDNAKPVKVAEIVKDQAQFVDESKREYQPSITERRFWEAQRTYDHLKRQIS